MAALIRASSLDAGGTSAGGGGAVTAADGNGCSTCPGDLFETRPLSPLPLPPLLALCRPPREEDNEEEDEDDDEDDDDADIAEAEDEAADDEDADKGVSISIIRFCSPTEDCRGTEAS